MAKETVKKTDLTKGPVAAQIAKDVQAQIDGAKATWATMRGYVELVAGEKLTPADAHGILLKVNAGIAAHRKANHDPRPVAEVIAVRTSEMASILRLGEYACWPTVFAHLKDLDVNRDTLNTVSKFVRSKITGDAAKKDAKACPPREKIMREIMSRKKARRGNGSDTRKGPLVIDKTRDPSKTIANVKREVTALAKWFGNDNAKRFAEAMLKSLASAKEAAAKIVKDRTTATA